MRKVFVIIFFIFYALNAAAFADVVKVLRVADGDTVIVIRGGNKERIRLIGLDCDETTKIYRAYWQAYESKSDIDEVIKRGKAAKKRLEGIIAASNREVTLVIEGKDKYDRALGRIYDSKNRDIGKMLVDERFCKPYIYKK
jgi:endonuclease YncB( thermonuclease family)